MMSACQDPRTLWERVLREDPNEGQDDDSVASEDEEDGGG